MLDNVYYKDPRHANDPVTGVIWAQADAYCKWVNGRLPTEAEWEKTARGPDGDIYPWGEGAPNCDLLNYNNCVGKTVEVTKYPEGAS
jgi:formylglycine-generating enzyme required for sulfatase activity